MSETHNLTEAAGSAVETAHTAPARDVVHDDHTHARSDTLLPYTMLGKYRLPFPLYSTVFLTLGIVTIVEVLIAEILPHELFITVLLLVVLSLFKAILVVYFYMHLREDNKIFAASLALPVIVGLIAMLFLAAVPPTGY
ncbi:MAG: cytochrome C oxidase subunit IV family protein [Anaerolinea sp.]|nr:cytochrome C oxidase subunit IV family protein [Anaerolinea sp.]